MKTTFAFDHYCLQKEIKERIEYFAEKYPALFSYEVLLDTPDGHQILACTLTNTATGAAKDKPAFHIDGNTHAGEVTGMMAALHTMDTLVTNYGEDKDVTFILDNFAVYIVPCVSPDGSETYLTTPHRLRSVDRESGETEKGLYQSDVDGDGALRMMRVPTLYGAWKKSPDDPDLMLRREPGDVEGEFYDIYTEGEIDGYDGLNIPVQKDKWGFDFNRNYPYGWFPEPRQSGAGPYPLSNPETKAMAQFIMDHPNIGSVATNHTSGGILLTVPGTYPEKKAPADDCMILNTLGELGKKITGYEHINIFDTFTLDQDNYASGAFDDYCYETQGIYAMTLELWDLDKRCGNKPFWEEKKPTLATDSEKFANRLKWVLENAPELFMHWTAFEHPQLGKVELGGFNFKFTVQNPPAKFLAQECEKISAYMVQWIKALPRLVIDRITLTDMGNGVTRCEALISNAGYLPTYLSRKAQALQKAKPVKVKLEGAQLLDGDSELDLGDLSSYALCPTGARFYGNIATMSSPAVTKKASWLVKGDTSGITVTAYSPKAGKVTGAVK